jgi:hypothetical protein
MIMPADLLLRNDRAAPAVAATADDELRAFARRHVERVHRLKLHAAAYVLGMIVLTPVWALTQWQTSGGFERWSTDHSQPGDWEPWILYVALVWGLFLGISALKVYFDRPPSAAEVEQEIARLKSRGSAGKR